MDTMRKQGVKQIKAKLATLMSNEDISLSQKLAQLNDGNTNDQIKEMMIQFCQ